jgi:hypothetical protein
MNFSDEVSCEYTEKKLFKSVIADQIKLIGYEWVVDFQNSIENYIILVVGDPVNNFQN